MNISIKKAGFKVIGLGSLSVGVAVVDERMCGSLRRQSLSRFHVHTVESFSFLDVQKRSRSPDPDRPIVWGTGQQSRQDGVPAHTVDRARVTAELCDGQLAAPVPDIDFVVWEQMRS